MDASNDHRSYMARTHKLVVARRELRSEEQRLLRELASVRAGRVRKAGVVGDRESRLSPEALRRLTGQYLEIRLVETRREIRRVSLALASLRRDRKRERDRPYRRAYEQSTPKRAARFRGLVKKWRQERNENG